MSLLSIFHVLHHGIEAVFSALALFAAYTAIKRFRLVIWRKGWYMIGASAVIFTGIELYELWGAAVSAEETFTSDLLVHTIHMIAFPLLTIGIFSLAKSAGRIWGRKDAEKK